MSLVSVFESKVKKRFNYLMKQRDSLMENLANRTITVNEYLCTYEVIDLECLKISDLFSSLNDLRNNSSIDEETIFHEEEHAEKALKYGVNCIFCHIRGRGLSVVGTIPINLSIIARYWTLEKIEKFELDFGGVSSPGVYDDVLRIKMNSRP